MTKWPPVFLETSKGRRKNGERKEKITTVDSEGSALSRTRRFSVSGASGDKELINDIRRERHESKEEAEREMKRWAREGKQKGRTCRNGK